MKRTCVIGGGIGGLALAIRLQAAGIATTLLDASQQPGGVSGVLARDGFTFETAPGAINDADGLRALWALSGRTLDDLDLMPVEPFTRFCWPDGTVFGASADSAKVRAGIARLSPGDAAGYEDLARLIAAIRAKGHALGSAALLGWG